MMAQGIARSSLQGVGMLIPKLLHAHLDYWKGSLSLNFSMCSKPFAGEEDLNLAFTKAGTAILQQTALSILGMFAEVWTIQAWV